MKKRSVKIKGHATSVSLEEEFWDALKKLAKEKSCSLSGLISEIDHNRSRQNLSSALRIYVLAALEKKLTAPQKDHR